MQGKAPSEVERAAVGWHVLPTRDDERPHPTMVLEAWKELGRDEEVLARVLVARDLDHATVHHALVPRVHALVDLVDDAERGLRHGL